MDVFPVAGVYVTTVFLIEFTPLRTNEVVWFHTIALGLHEGLARARIPTKVAKSRISVL